MSEEAAAPVAPPIDFMTFIMTFYSTALVHLGELADPATGEQGPISIPLAKANVEIIEMLDEKTDGNLTGEEERILNELLKTLRAKLAAHSA